MFMKGPGYLPGLRLTEPGSPPKSIGSAKQLSHSSGDESESPPSRSTSPGKTSPTLACQAEPVSLRHQVQFYCMTTNPIKVLKMHKSVRALYELAPESFVDCTDISIQEAHAMALHFATQVNRFNHSAKCDKKLEQLFPDKIFLSNKDMTIVRETVDTFMSGSQFKECCNKDVGT